FGDALDHQVVAFRSAAGEDDLFRSCPNQIGDLDAGILDGFFAGPAEGVVAAGRVAKFIGEIRYHRFEHARINLSGGVVVKIDLQFYSHDSVSPVGNFETYLPRPARQH